MSWLQRYRIRHYFGTSIWVFPVLGALAAVAAVRALHWMEREMGWVSPVDADTARAVLGTMASALFTCIVFVCTALLVAVQLASAALSPRIIGLVFRDPVTKFALTLLIFTFTFSLSALIRIKATVPLLSGHVAAYANLLSLCVFLYLIDHLGKALRPSGALLAVARLGRKVIESVYPHRLADSKPPFLAAAEVLEGKPTRLIASVKDGAVLAFDIRGLVALAERADCVIELVPQVGDFIAYGDPLFRIFQGGENLSEETLCQSVAVGQERTPEQDPGFAFRIIVDIASKGLSPAINDPTTAVLAIDQIHHLLRNVGIRRLDDERVRDATGRLRLAYRTPDWEDFVELAVTEIRQYGGTSIQIARRLRAMLENLIQALPEERAARLRLELEKLPRSAKRCFPEPADLDLAEIGDLQGVGGKRSGLTDARAQKGGAPDRRPLT
jgi:uncharacterized membrane protein